MKLIDADKLIEHMFLGTEYDKTVDDNMGKTEAMCKAFKCGWNDALASVMDYAPTVDAVPLEDYRSMEQTVNKLTKAIAKNETTTEVVRCKDCKKYIPCQKLPIGTSKWCDMFDRATCEMNYCGWGERRENE